MVTGPENQGLVAPEMNRTHQLAITLYKRGLSARDVGELLDLPRGTVSGLVARAGVIRGRAEATRLARRNRQVRTHIAHVTLLSDVVEAVAGKLGITAELLLAVLADRHDTTSHPTSHPTGSTTACTTDRATDRAGGLGDGLGGDVGVPVAGEPVAGGLSCVAACLFGCTHRCARRITPVQTVAVRNVAVRTAR